MATTQKRVKMPRQKEKYMTTSSYVMLIGLVAFLAMIGILFQHALITEKNTEIRELQKPWRMPYRTTTVKKVNW